MINEQEQLNYQRAQEMYQETQRRKNVLSEKDKKLFRQLKQVEIGRYDVTFYTVCMIAELYQNNAINAFDTIFRLGFMKGQRSEKAKLKKRVNRNV